MIFQRLRQLLIQFFFRSYSRKTSSGKRENWSEVGDRNLSGLKELMNEKIESSKKQEENNLVLQEMLKSLEEANLDSSQEIAELELLENKLVNNLEINNSIQSSLDNLNNYSHDEPSVAFLINQSIKNFK